MGANTHYDYISTRGGVGSSLTSVDNFFICHAELVSASQKNKNLCEKINLQTINVIPHLLRDLIDKIRSRNKSGMTELSCHPEVPEARQHSGSLCNFTGHPEAIAEGSQKVDEMLKQVQNDKYVSGAHSKHLFPYSPITLFTSKKAAFTLAEVLITLALIGIVAAMTIPTLIQNYQERSWNTASLVFQRKLGDALTIMNSQGTLAGYSSTDDFVAELARHMKISKICQNDDLTSCFPDKVIWGDEEVDMTKVKTVKNFGRDDWENTNLIGAMFADGTAGLIAYNKDCKQDPYSNRVITISKETGIGTDCLAVLYDTTGFKTPNTNLKDLRGLNVLSLAGNSCAFEINGTCFTAPFTPAPLTMAECEKLKDNLGIKRCDIDDDYWAGAVKACGGVSKMPTAAQLADIANYVYNTSGISGNKSGLKLDYDKVAELGFTASQGSDFSVWSNEEYNIDLSYGRYFYQTCTYWNAGSRGGSIPQAVCLGD